MSTVMIQPASYEDTQQAIDLAFEIFPLNLKDKKQPGQVGVSSEGQKRGPGRLRS